MRRSRQALSKTTQGGGSTTATSLPTWTPEWPVGTWWRADPLRRERMPRSHLVAAAVAAAALLAPAGASAQNDYPPPSNPGGTGKTHGKGHTLTVCKKG